MYVDNQKFFGHLVNSDNFETTHKHNDLYAMVENRYVSCFHVSTYPCTSKQN